ncbi:MAG: fructose-1,6-bisphosphatase [Bacteroidaceae bacterium]|nr:fructose-1,6-bisphosphatase [Bacteroidaceae bacterium]MDO4738748.1 fructose-1,6-bisphosphatase [Bacteroidales bacterium]
MENKRENILTEEEIKEDLRYLQLLAQSYPNVAEASCEIINLEAILNLPKPTEHFISDPHGESDAFNHVLRNASGYVKRKVEEIFGPTLRLAEKQDLCTLIYYPEAKLQRIKAAESNLNDFYIITLNQLIKVLREVSSKYTRSKIRKELPKEFGYIIEELLHESHSGVGDKRHQYYNMIVQTIIDTQRADHFIVSISNLIQRLAIDRLHLLGDIFDRGPGAHLIMETLMNYHNFDIVWGNHDIEWFGAAAGNRACIANVLRLSLRYGNLATLEDGYSINLLPLATFAMETYKDDPCKLFGVRELSKESQHDQKTHRLIAQMHKAITVIQFKEEAKIISRRPEFDMDDRKLLEHINFEKGTCTINGDEYEMLDTFLPTVSKDNPNALTEEEEMLMEKLKHSFLTSDKLQRHVQCLLAHGCMYSISNSNLMYHATVPLNYDGSLKEVEIGEKKYKGMALMKKTGHLVREAFNNDTPPSRKSFAKDYIWYLWCGKNSPLFDKDKMTTFERYFIKDKSTHAETKGYYYKYSNDEHVVDMILDNFEVEGKHRHIINGHTPVKVLKGETPIKANGKLLVIDGGFSRAYQPETGIAGYTLTFHSRGLELVQHQPFLSAEDAIENGDDIKSSTQIVELSSQRMYVKDTDRGKVLLAKIDNLKRLLFAYRNGFIKEVK